MKTKPSLTPDEFRYVVERVKLVSIDLVLVSPDARILVGRRNYQPARGMFFLPGGCIWKSETRRQAFDRLLETEVGLQADFNAAVFLGVFDHHYDSNRFEDPSFGTDYVAMGYRVQLDSIPELDLDDQHSEVRWMTPQDLLAAPDVHDNTKAYIRVSRA